MAFDDRMVELIALGASVAANCQSCVEHHGRKAAEYGLDPQEVAQAIDIGRTVRKGAAAKVDRAADELLQRDASATSATTTAHDAAAACCSMMSGRWPSSTPWGTSHKEEHGTD